MIRKATIAAVFASILLSAACGINSVTKAELEKVKAGDTVVYRYQKDGKSWFYADKITRVDGDTLYYNPGTNEVTAGNDSRVYKFDTDRQLEIKRADLLKYDTEQGDDRKVIIWINP
jgi:hypothetical protein